MSQQLRMAGRLWLLFAAFLLAQGARAQLLTDDFSATTLPYSLTAPGGGWAAHSGGGTNSVMATTPTLTYAGLATAGGSATLTTSGEDVNRQFAQQTSGAVYASFLVNFTSAQAAGDYFFHLGPATLGTTFIGRVFAKSATGGFQVGVSKGTDTAGPVYGNTVYALNTTYFVVLKYTFVAGGTTNDLVDLFIQPAIGQPEPTPSVSTTSVVADLANAGTVALRQGTSSSAPSVRVDYIRVGTSWADVTSGTTPVAALSANPTSLTGFVATQGTVSNVQTYTLTGSTLNGNPVSVSATANVELSTTAGGTFTPTLSLPAAGSAISQTIYARLTSAAPTGAFSGTITNTANGTLTAAVTVSGQVNAVNAPTLTASPTTLSSFTTSQGTVSAEKTYTLTAANLTGAISVSAPVGVEVSQTTGSGFGSSLTLPQSTTSAVVYVHLTGSGAVGNVSGTITNIAGSLTANVAMSGTVSSTAPVGPYTPIATARAGIGSTFTVAGRVTVSTQLGARQIYIQDATGGIAVYSGPTPAPDFTTLVNIGDSVQVRGPVTVFSGYLELTGTGNFTVVAGAGNRVPTPVAITPDQLANYQGQLVSVANATITPVAGSFSGGTNYTITAGGASGILRISANSPLSGAGQPANPVSVTGIADRFVSGGTTTGNDNLQLQPRILADVPGSTPATDLTCTVGSGSALTRDQTLDIAAWNMEFFGADGGTISCPGGTTLTYQDMGPVNEDLQQTNATQVLTRLNADIISTEEVSDINRFAAAVKAIPGSYSYICSDKFSYFFQNECDQVPSGNPPTVFGPTSLAQKVCVVYNTATVTPVLAETKPLLFLKTADYTYPGALGGNGNGSGWASGRLPFLFVANVTINGITKKIHVVAVHAKSGSAAADFNRRVQDYNDLKAELDQNYPTANVIILGDYNDKATTSIYTSSPISSFNSFVTDVTNYSVVTKPLEQGGCVTYNPSGGSFIDQITVSNDLQKGYLANTAYVLQPFSIPNYGTTTSDHSPIEARFDISLLASPLTSLSLTASASPATLLTTGTTTLSATVSGGTAPYSYAFSGPGTITPSGNTATVSGLTAGVQSFTLLAKDATAPASQTLSATVSVTVNTPAPTGPATLTITAFNCFSTNGALSSVTFVVGSSDGTTAPALPPLFINGVTTSGQLGQAYTLNFDANAAPVAIQDNASRATYFVWNYRTACAGPGTPPTPTPPVAPTLPNQTAVQGTVFSYGVPAFSGTAPLTYSATGLPAGLNFTAASRTISGTPSTPGVSTVVISASNAAGQSSGQFTLTVSGSATQPTGPATLTITAFSCNIAGSGSGSVTFVVGYSDGTTAPALPPLFINGVTTGGQLGQAYTLNFDANAAPVAIQDNASRATYFVWNYRTACAGPGTPPTPTPPVAPTLPNQTAVQGTVFSYGVPAFSGTAPLTYSATGLPAGLNFTAASRTISGTPSTPGVSTVVISASNAAGQSSGQFTLTVSGSATQPTGPATLTITAFSCNIAGSGSGSVTFVVGYSDGTTAPALPPLFINGVTTGGQLGQAYTLNFDANAAPVAIQDNASQSVYFVWNYRGACASRGGRQGAEGAPALQISVLGNPVRHTIEADVTGAEGQPLTLLLTNGQGQSLGQHNTDRAEATEKVQFNVYNQPTGILLLRATTPGQSQTIRVLKVD